MSARRVIGTLLLATHNVGKRREIADLLSPLGITVVSAADLNLPEPEETGDSFAANARLKAEAACAQASLPALADDSGLCIPALDGAPGIYSARWTGEGRNYRLSFDRIQKELAARGVSDPHPQAYFLCVLCLCMPGGEAHFFEGRVDGRLTFPPRGAEGFGYDPVFIPEGYNITFAEMPLAEKQRMSHRARAMAALVAFLEKKA